MTARARAKTLILSWFDKGRPSAELRKRFSSDVDRFFETIAARNDWRECLTTVLDDNGALYQISLITTCVPNRAVRWT